MSSSWIFTRYQSDKLHRSDIKDANPLVSFALIYLLILLLDSDDRLKIQTSEAMKLPQAIFLTLRLRHIYALALPGLSPRLEQTPRRRQWFK